MKYFLYCLQHYADFNGRARRSEYWYFALFNLIISFVIGFTFGVIAGILDMPALDNLTYLWSLAVFPWFGSFCSSFARHWSQWLVVAPFIDSPRW